MSQHWTCAKCARNGVAFELNPDGLVLRIAPETLREALLPATFVTEDAVLNSLLETASSMRTSSVSRHRGPARAEGEVNERCTI
jgi:hypothetical protein